MTTLHKDKLMEEEAQRQKKAEEIAKVQGKQVDKKIVCIEYYDSSEERPVIRSCAANVKLVNMTLKNVGKER